LFVFEKLLLFCLFFATHTTHEKNTRRYDVRVKNCLCTAGRQWRTQKIFMEGFHSLAYDVIRIWCALFVTSWFDVIFMFSKPRFGEVCADQPYQTNWRQLFRI